MASLKAVKHQIPEFSQASGLIANLEKSTIYTACIDENVQGDIEGILGMHLNKLPFRYFGVPLSHKKLTVSQYMPLVDSITKRV